MSQCAIFAEYRVFAWLELLIFTKYLFFIKRGHIMSAEQLVKHFGSRHGSRFMV